MEDMGLPISGSGEVITEKNYTSARPLKALEPQNDIRIQIMQTVPVENVIRGLVSAIEFVKALGPGQYDLLLELSKRDDDGSNK